MPEKSGDAPAAGVCPSPGARAADANPANTNGFHHRMVTPCPRDASPGETGTRIVV